MRTSVGIDVSKGKSMVAAIISQKEVVFQPKEFLHTQEGLTQMVNVIKAMGSQTKVILEATGHYHEIVLETLSREGIFTSLVNPTLVYNFGNNSVRQVKTDRKDALKIARYGLENWDELREYTPPEIIRRQLKTFSRQYNLCIKTTHSLENNLITLLDKTFPGLNRLFSSHKRKGGHQKWVDFAATFWHVAIIKEMDINAFMQEYRRWCASHGYQFKEEKAQAHPSVVRLL